MNPYSFMLLGGAGTGKTHSAATLLQCKGIEKVCFLFTETSESTFDSEAFAKAGLGKELGKRLHYMRAIPVAPSFSSMISTADDLLKLSFEGLQKKPIMGDKEIRQAYHKILFGLTSFKCEVTGEEMPVVDEWPSSWALVVDSLSGINSALKKLQVGSKPIMALQDWQIVMNMEEELIQRLTGALQCQVVLTAHTTRERDEVTGTSNVYPNALGSKLGPNIGKYFSEVIQTKYSTSKKEFLWSTVERNTDLKSRLLPRSNELRPTFAQIKQLNGDNA